MICSPILIAGCLCVLAVSKTFGEETVTNGMPRQRVMAILGYPKGSMSSPRAETLIYERGVITLTSGKVSYVSLISMDELERRKQAQQALAVSQSVQESPFASGTMKVHNDLTMWGEKNTFAKPVTIIEKDPSTGTMIGQQRGSLAEITDDDVDSDSDAQPDFSLPSMRQQPRYSISDPAEEARLGGKTRKGNYLGQLGGNRFDPNSTRNPFGAGNQFSPDSIKNDFGQYGSKFSPHSPRNPYAVDTPKLYDSQGNYRGKLSSNPYDPDSISNPYGRYGNKFSPDSINNPFGAGNPFSPDSPKNPFGKGLSIYGDDE